MRCDRSIMNESEEGDARIEVPSYFKCPISLCLMTDPVSICTGITYERSSIQKWLDEGRATCPVTMQPLASHDLIPNHTLRRIITAWCAANKQQEQQQQSLDEAALIAAVVSSPPKHRQQQEESKVLKARDAASLVRELCHDSSRPAALKKVADAAAASGANREWLAAAGLGVVLVGMLARSSAIDDEEAEVAVAVLAQVGLDDSARSGLVSGHGLAAVARLLCRGAQPARVASAAVLEDVAAAGGKEAALAVGGAAGVLEGLVRLARDGGSRGNGKAVRASLRAALAICSPMKNRVRMVEWGAVATLVEMLPDSERSATEAILAVLECLCGCAEGRAAVSTHALAAPAVAKKLFRVSPMATEYAVDVLWAVCRYAPDESVRRRMVDAGLFPKLFFFLQIGCNPRTKHKAGDLLKLLHRAYRDCCLEDAGGNNNQAAHNNTCLLSS